MADMWNNAVVTTKGLLLQSKVATGGTINFTKVKTGSGKVTASQLQSQTDVTSKKQEFLFSAESTVNKETGLVTLVAVIDNDNLTTGYDCYQVGVYANDPDNGEILYAILQSDTALYVPAEANVVGWIAEMNIGMQYGNATTVNIAMNQAGAVTREAFEEHVADTKNPHKVTAEQTGARPNTWLPTASEIGAAQAVEYNVKTYTKLDQIGIVNSNMSVSDFNANTLAIIKAMPDGATLVMSDEASDSNFIASLIAKIKTDLGVNITNADSVSLKLEKFGSALMPVKLEVTTKYVTSKQIWVARCIPSSSSVTWSPFAVAYNPNGFLTPDYITFGTAPLTDGVSSLKKGHIYLQIEA